MSQGTPQTIPVASVRVSKIKLRETQRQTESYQNLLASIRKSGVLQSIVVREDRDQESGEKFYLLIDGLQRLSCCQDLGLESVNANVFEMDEKEMLTAQFVANYQRIATKPAEFGKHIDRLLGLDPVLTISALAEQLSCSESFLKERMKLVKLQEEIQVKVDEGQIPLLNAIALSSLPMERQAEYVADAMTDEVKVFGPKIAKVVKEIRDAKKGARKEVHVFEPHMYGRRVGDIKDEVQNDFQVGRAYIDSLGLSDEALKGWELGVSWTVNFDPKSQEEQIAKNAAKEQEKKEAAERRKAEREAEKARKAQEAEAEIAEAVGG